MNRNKIKASALYAISETLLIAATLAAGLGIYHLTASIPTIAVVLAIAFAFGVNSFLAPMLTDVFGPTIDRLRGLTPKGAEQR